jgi:hypothetical protein
VAASAPCGLAATRVSFAIGWHKRPVGHGREEKSKITDTSPEKIAFETTNNIAVHSAYSAFVNTIVLH